MLVYRLQTALHKKAMVVVAFGLRLPIIAFTAARIATVDTNIANFAITESLYIVWTVTEINYSLMSTTLPLLRPFIKDLSTYYGTMTASLYDGSNSRSRSNSYPLTALGANNVYSSKGSRRSMPPSEKIPTNQEDSRVIDFGGTSAHVPETLPQNKTQVQGGASRPGNKPNASRNSLGSDSSQRMIIRVDTEWAVER